MLVIFSDIEILVYIPHSSDKTLVSIHNLWFAFNVYIPHSSDKTEYDFNTRTRKIKVYIPHSSDKTPPMNATLSFLSVFTSLIVQIKLDTIYTSQIWILVYIPHSSDKTDTI